MARGDALATQTLPTGHDTQRVAGVAPGVVAGLASRNREIGYWGLLVLAFVLPFDAEGRPLVWTSYLTVTNVTALLMAVTIIAAITTAGLAMDAVRGRPGAAEYFSERRIPLALLAAFLVSSAVSTVLAHSSTQSLTWFLGVVTGALLWLALPLWMAGGSGGKVARLGAAFVAGAVVASIIGLIEVLAGSSFEQHLLLFKYGPATMGPYLRLSATFSSANVAAMYLELALPFAVAGLIGTLGRTSRRWMVFVAWLAAIDTLFVALALTFSRGALLGLVAAGLAMLLTGRRAWHSHSAAGWRAPALIVVGSLALIFGVLALSTSSIGLLRFSTQNDRAWYQASFISSVPPTMSAGRTRTIRVTVENRSPLSWDGSRPHTYGVSYHWLYPSWAVVRFANNITWLSTDLRPGNRQSVQATVWAPRAPGRYLLVWDMVWKGSNWFGPRTGTYHALPVQVTEASAHAGPSGAIGRNPPPDIASLPTASPLDRATIWDVAMRMIVKRPLIGEGPQGLRMNFTAVAPSDVAAQAGKPPPHAHNLALEMLADWGIVGGGLFFGLLAALWWPLLRRVWKGQMVSVWDLALIGAAAALLGHQLVDYFLTKQSIFIILWLLAGLATIKTRRASPDSQSSSTPY